MVGLTNYRREVVSLSPRGKTVFVTESASRDGTRSLGKLYSRRNAESESHSIFSDTVYAHLHTKLIEKAVAGYAYRLYHIDIAVKAEAGGIMQVGIYLRTIYFG